MKPIRHNTISLLSDTPARVAAGRLVTVTGDGGFLMNSQELETAVREGVAFVTLRPDLPDMTATWS